MTKDELIRLVSQKNGISIKQSRKIVQTIFDSISSSIVAGDKVKITGFGTFEAKKRSAFRIKHPKSGEVIDIPDSFQPSFEPSKQLKEKVNKSICDLTNI